MPKGKRGTNPKMDIQEQIEEALAQGDWSSHKHRAVNARFLRWKAHQPEGTDEGQLKQAFLAQLQESHTSTVSKRTRETKEEGRGDDGDYISIKDLKDRYEDRKDPDGTLLWQKFVNFCEHMDGEEPDGEWIIPCRYTGETLYLDYKAKKMAWQKAGQSVDTVDSWSDRPGTSSASSHQPAGKAKAAAKGKAKAKPGANPSVSKKGSQASLLEEDVGETQPAVEALKSMSKRWAQVVLQHKKWSLKAKSESWLSKEELWESISDEIKKVEKTIEDSDELGAIMLGESPEKDKATMLARKHLGVFNSIGGVMEDLKKLQDVAKIKSK